MKILQAHDNDELLDIVECPNCGKAALYGDMRMISGYSGCSNCFFQDLFPRVRYLQEHDREKYDNGPVYLKEGG